MNQKQRELIDALFLAACVYLTAIFYYIGWGQGVRYGIAASVGCVTGYLSQEIRKYRKKPENGREKEGSL